VAGTVWEGEGGEGREAIFELKLRWKVSARAIIRRAYDLSLISADRHRTGNVHLNKTGQSKIEQYDNVIAPETPELLERAFQTLEDVHPGSIRRIANSIGLDLPCFGCWSADVCRKTPPLSKIRRSTDSMAGTNQLAFWYA
jgi:hypothetical protein